MTDRTPAIADIDRCIATIESSTKRWSGNADYRRFLETELFCLREVKARLEAPAPDDAEERHYLGAIRLRLEQLYHGDPSDCRLREQVSDEISWIDARLGDGE